MVQITWSWDLNSTRTSKLFAHQCLIPTPIRITLFLVTDLSSVYTVHYMIFAMRPKGTVAWGTDLGGAHPLPQLQPCRQPWNTKAARGSISKWFSWMWQSSLVDDSGCTGSHSFSGLGMQGYGASRVPGRRGAAYTHHWHLFIKAHYCKSYFLKHITLCHPLSFNFLLALCLSLSPLFSSPLLSSHPPSTWVSWFDLGNVIHIRRLLSVVTPSTHKLQHRDLQGEEAAIQSKQAHSTHPTGG